MQRKEVSVMFSPADKAKGRKAAELQKLESAERQYIQELYLNHYPTLQRAVRHLGFRGEAAEDWIQETFLIAIQRIDVLKECASPGAYLTQILRNVIGHHLRSSKYAARILEKLQETQQTEYEDEADPATLYHGLVKDEELRLLLRFYLEGRSRKELARELGIDVEACSKRIQRAKAHLKAAMKRDGLL